MRADRPAEGLRWPKTPGARRRRQSPINAGSTEDILIFIQSTLGDVQKKKTS